MQANQMVHTLEPNSQLPNRYKACYGNHIKGATLLQLNIFPRVMLPQDQTKVFIIISTDKFLHIQH